MQETEGILENMESQPKKNLGGDPRAPLTRRESLRRIGAGFGSLGLAGVMANPELFASHKEIGKQAISPLSPKAPHFAPRAKHVIQLFMPGGPSQVDTFDHKPDIARHAGKRPSLVNRKSL